MSGRPIRGDSQVLGLGEKLSTTRRTKKNILRNERNLEMGETFVGEYGWVWAGLIWLRIEESGGLLWKRK
jgi:hypothetical protein